ncbi:GNAT family N-acetyltransferase [Entomohabitans teleogrylli]|uniref:GNAT family N-acetyltransferase n=1 Tax=Entomohabitans teleogrylli TaxID=1384589 RepID=UPI00073D21F7|nr:GNAT family protein [Entomohabitans teleogrylli]
MEPLTPWGQPIGPALPDWHDCPLPGAVTLVGRYCLLEPLAEQHASELYAAFREAPDTRSWTWLTHEAPTSPEEYQSRVSDMAHSQDPRYFAVVSQQTRQPVGIFSLMRIDPKNGVIEVGHVHFSPRLQRTPAATEAHWLLMRYVFNTLGYRRYEWKCDSLNQPSRQAALRLGFQFEGIFRQAMIYKGRSRDTAWFSLLDSEWPATDRALQSWLAPQNFDAEGKQRYSLASFRQS